MGSATAATRTATTTATPIRWTPAGASRTTSAIPTTTGAPTAWTRTPTATVCWKTVTGRVSRATTPAPAARPGPVTTTAPTTGTPISTTAMPTASATPATRTSTGTGSTTRTTVPSWPTPTRQTRTATASETPAMPARWMPTERTLGISRPASSRRMAGPWSARRPSLSSMTLTATASRTPATRWRAGRPASGSTARSRAGCGSSPRATAGGSCGSPRAGRESPTR